MAFLYPNDDVTSIDVLLGLESNDVFSRVFRNSISV
jgi:hypothetical protein